ncbi:MAG: hypothetical protein V4669_05830 [Pseudomonadota bacterium]
MKKQPLAVNAIAPMFLWMDIAAKTTQLLVSSSVVINNRVGRMVAAGPNPSARDRKEFQRMGTEKVTAFNQSALAAWQQLMLGSLAGSAQMTSAALAPIHRTATANARRLSGGSRRSSKAR